MQNTWSLAASYPALAISVANETTKSYRLSFTTCTLKKDSACFEAVARPADAQTDPYFGDESSSSR